MTSESLDSREESIVRRLARIQRHAAYARGGAPSGNGEPDSDAQPSLESYARLISLLSDVSFQGTEFETPSNSQTRSDEDIPARIWKFELLEECGRGGFGMVFRARDTILHREVALKLPLPGCIASQELRQRFLAEARTAAALNHPNLVPILEADQIGPICYIAYAFCRGPSLSQWIRANKEVVDAHAAATLIEQVARALTQAHAKGICHRDIKPSNILLDSTTETSRQELFSSLSHYEPKLTDFGLARWIDSPSPLSTTGQLVGTVRYMSPEQVEGKSEKIGPASDVYSLGVVLYELLTGRAPFSDENEVRVLVKTLHEEAPSLIQARPDVKRELSIICMKCLEKDPARRYSSAQELADDLRRYLDGVPIRAKAKGIATRVVGMVRRRPIYAVLLAFAFVSLAVGTIEIRRFLAIRRAEEATRNAMAKVAASELDRSRLHYARQMRLAYQSWEAGDVQDAIARLQSAVPEVGKPDPRGFLWRWLWRRCWYDGYHIGAQDGPAYSVALDVTGRWLAVGGDRVVTLWDVKAWKQCWCNVEIPGEIDSIVFSTDGERFFSAGSDRDVRVWEVENGRCETLSLPGEGPIESLAAFPDGKRLAIGDAAGEILVWNLEQRAVITRLSQHRAEINDLVIDTHGQYLFSAGSDALVHHWDIESGHILQTFRGHEGSVTDLALVGNDEVLLTGGVDGTIRRWSIADGKLLGTKQAHNERLDAMAASDAQNLLVTSSKDCTVKMWRADSLESMAAMQLSRRAWDLVCESSAPQFWSVRDDGRIAQWSQAGINFHVTRPTPKAHLLATTADGNFIAHLGIDENVEVHQVGDGFDSKGLSIAAPAVGGLAFCRSGSAIATRGMNDDLVRFWDRANGRALGVFTSDIKIWPDLLAGETSLILKATVPNSIVVIDDAPNAKLLRSFGPFDGFVTAAASAFDGSIAIWKEMDSMESEIEIFGKAHDRTARYSTKTNGWSHRFIMSPDSPWLAAFVPPASLLLWNYDTSSEPIVCSTPGTISAMSFSPRESLLALGSKDGRIRFYSFPEWELIATIPVNSGPIKSLVFSPSGTWMAAGSVSASLPEMPEGEITLWNVSGGRPAKER